MFGGITGGIAKLQGPNANILNGSSDGSKSLFPYHGLAKYVKINVTLSLQFNSARNLTYQGVHQLNGIFGDTLADVAVGDVVGNPVTGRSQRQVGTLLESVDDIFANPSC